MIKRYTELIRVCWIEFIGATQQQKVDFIPPWIGLQSAMKILSPTTRCPSSS